MRCAHDPCPPLRVSLHDAPSPRVREIDEASASVVVVRRAAIVIARVRRGSTGAPFLVRGDTQVVLNMGESSATRRGERVSSRGRRVEGVLHDESNALLGMGAARDRCVRERGRF
jgi:hypothetical protein